ncbi:hypothetical protein [Bacillus sp. EB600]|uniref:hypothetical protein n=1 Tax=Bacillus sp. EB600 TaxID=2806345 RepID=UPI00210A1994|nr:hypothetical protein [Bacillus sp. EB600]
MKRRFNKYTMPVWFQNLKRIFGQFVIPICVFQGIRTIFLPTVFDVLLFTFLILLALAIYLEII